jgi:hypothetical protein
MLELIQEIRIIPQNSYKFYKLVPKQYKTYHIDQYNLHSAFIFNVDDKEYIVIYDKRNRIHFWNHTENENQPDNDSVRYDDLNIFSGAEPLKIAATLFSIIKWLMNKNFYMFIIEVPNGRRDKIYSNLVKTNAPVWFPDFTVTELHTGLAIYKLSPFKESIPLVNSKFNKLVRSILEQYWT